MPWQARQYLLRPRRLHIALAALLLSLVVVALRPPLAFYRLASPSMEPTLHCAGQVGCRALRGDTIVVANSWIFAIRDIQRGDIVVIHGPDDGTCIADRYAVKRIVAIPGDVVPGQIAARAHSSARPGGTSRLVLGSDQYFALGDNPSDSCDSRAFGPIARSDIRGLVLLAQNSLWSLRFPD
jgi:signal peptidase I